MSESPRFASYKLRFHEDHVRAVPVRDEKGCPFAGPGVDLRGDAAATVLALAEPMRAWLLAREPGVRVRSISIDRAAPRVLVTLEAEHEGERPRVVRLEGESARDFLRGAEFLERELAARCVEALLRRR